MLQKFESRVVTTFRAIEFLIFVDGWLLESQMFHGNRSGLYASELRVVVEKLIEDGWIEEPQAKSHD